MTNNLPDGWQPALLNDVSVIVTGKTPSTKNQGNFGGSIPFIKPADLNSNGYVHGTADTLTDLGALSVQTIPKNSIPVTCIGNLGKVGITKEESATNQQINTVVPSSFCDFRFLYYQLQTLKSWMQENASATTVTIINKGKFAKAPIVLPPLAEQKVIADTLDTLLAQVDNTKARLERIPEILKRFRQSVLAAAVSGRLTEEWRGSADLVGWQKNQLGQFIEKPTYGSSAKSQKIGDVPVLRMGNLQKGQLDWTDLVYTSDPSEIEKYRLEDGDVLFNRTNSPELVGKTSIFRGEREAVYAGYLIKVKCLSGLNPEFLNYQLNSPKAKSYCKAVKSDGVSQSNINAKKLAAYPLNCPPLEEQTEIVRRIDQLFAYADTVERQVNSALKHVNQLTQSILAKAFRGELTAQWREDNPELISGDNSAEALLARIRAARAAQAPKQRTRKKATV